MPLPTWAVQTPSPCSSPPSFDKQTLHRGPLPPGLRTPSPNCRTALNTHLAMSSTMEIWQHSQMQYCLTSSTALEMSLWKSASGCSQTRNWMMNQVGMLLWACDSAFRSGDRALYRGGEALRWPKQNTRGGQRNISTTPGWCVRAYRPSPTSEAVLCYPGPRVQRWQRKWIASLLALSLKHSTRPHHYNHRPCRSRWYTLEGAQSMCKAVISGLHWHFQPVPGTSHPPTLLEICYNHPDA